MDKKSLSLTIDIGMQETSRFEEKRGYLGMSQISQCPLKIYNEFMSGHKATMRDYRNAWRGYMYEDKIRDILIRRNYCEPGSEREIVAGFDSRFRGHLDCVTRDGHLIEIKSMNNQIFMTNKLLGKIPTRHYDQVQCYMRYGGFDHCFVVMIDTQTSEVESVYIKRNDDRGLKLEEKAKYILKHIDIKNPPVCECAKCQPTKGLIET